MTERVFIIEDLLSPEECQYIIEKFTNSDLVKADLNGADYMKGTIYDKQIADVLQSRLGNRLPKDNSVVGLSDRLRFSKYDKGGEFAIHQDGIHQDPRTGHRSAYTLSIYLNDTFAGGETTFFDGNDISGLLLSMRLGWAPLMYRGSLGHTVLTRDLSSSFRAHVIYR